MIRTAHRLAIAATAATTAILLAACGSTPADTSTSGDAETAISGDPSASQLETITPGKLTIATGEPAYSPWVEDDDPTTGNGLESAVAYAVAAELGFDAADVVWIRTPFDTVIAPGPKDFDLNLQQFSITTERQAAVDFSSPYYTSSQGVLSIKGNKGADATTLVELKDAKIGVAAGSSSIDVATNIIAPTTDIAVFNSNDDAVQALIAGTIDVIVTDLPTTLYLANAELDNGVVVGQLDSTEGGDQYAFLLAKDSPLTASVTAAVDSLRASGKLDELAQTWITEGAGAPILK